MFQACVAQVWLRKGGCPPNSPVPDDLHGRLSFTRRDLKYEAYLRIHLFDKLLMFGTRLVDSGISKVFWRADRSNVTGTSGAEGFRGSSMSPSLDSVS